VRDDPHPRALKPAATDRPARRGRRGWLPACSTVGARSRDTNGEEVEFLPQPGLDGLDSLVENSAAPASPSSCTSKRGFSTVTRDR